MGLRALLLGCALAMLFGAQARAQPVVLELEACPVPAPNEVRALVSLELKERLLSAQADAPPEAQHVQLSCSDIKAEVVLRETGAYRSLSLASVPPSLRARLLSLSIAELAREGGEPRREQPEPAALVVRGPEPVERAPARRPKRYLLSAGAELQATPLLGLAGALSFLWRASPWLSLASSLSAGQTRSALADGTLRVRSASLRSGPALTWQRAQLLLTLGLGARAGLLQLTGEPDDRRTTRAESFRSWYIAPAAFAGLFVLLGAHGFVALELELAHTLRRLRAEVVGGADKGFYPLRTGAQLCVGAAW